MAKYKVTGTIKIEVELTIDDETLTTKLEAIEIGTGIIKDFYNLDVVGGYHDSDKCEITIDANRIKKD